MSLSYTYDGQFRRYLQQFMRIFNGFKVKQTMRDGREFYKRVPVVFGDMSRQVGHILRNNSENTILPTPMVSCYITGIEMAPERRMNPTHVDTRQVNELAFDGGEYGSTSGNKYTVQRFMPVPYNLSVTADIWTTNYDDKYQLLEQILVLFNPAVELQTSTNALDWTAITTIELLDVTHSSKSVPAGVDDSMDIASMHFKIMAWVNPPAKVKKQSVIEQIVTNVDMTGTFEVDGIRDMQALNDFTSTFTDFDPVGESTTQVITTPGDHHILVEDGLITLLDSAGRVHSEAGNVYAWDSLVAQYSSSIRDGITRLRLRPVSDVEQDAFDYVGRVWHTDAPNVLRWVLDLESIPADTLPPVDRVIDPLTMYPGHKLDLPEDGQRYLILEDIPSAVAWEGLSAAAESIIERVGGAWRVSFEPSDGVQYVTNLRTDKKLKWNGIEWLVLPDGEYSPGFWRMVF